MNKFIAKTMQGDKVVWIISILLFFVSMVEMYSASSMLVHRSNSVYDPILRHTIFYAVGFVALLIVQLIEFRYIRMFGYLGLFFSLVFLVVLMLGFGKEQAGAARFFEIGGFQFQPSEIAKVSLIIVVADIIERFQNEETQDKYYLYLALLVCTVCGIIFLENLSTAALLFSTIMIMMWVGDIKLKKILATIALVVSIVAIILLVAWFIPENVYRQYEDCKIVGLFERAYTWVARIENFFIADAEVVSKFKVTDSNFQENHAQMAIARGGLFFRGPGTSVESNYLPEAFSDFIFAIIVEELGAILGIIIMILYICLLIRAGIVANKSDSLFCAILVIGVTLMIVLQALVHIGVSVHLIPVTGQPLPLVSRGGTSTLINCLYIGIIISVTRYIQQQNKKKGETISDIPSVSSNVTAGNIVSEIEDTGVIEEIN